MMEIDSVIPTFKRELTDSPKREREREKERKEQEREREVKCACVGLSERES